MPYSKKKTAAKTAKRVGILVVSGAITGIIASLTGPDAATAFQDMPWLILLVPAIQGGLEAVLDWLKYKN